MFLLILHAIILAFHSRNLEIFQCLLSYSKLVGVTVVRIYTAVCLSADETVNILSFF